jgi:hypothetical protein
MTLVIFQLFFIILTSCEIINYPFLTFHILTLQKMNRADIFKQIDDSFNENWLSYELKERLERQNSEISRLKEST